MKAIQVLGLFSSRLQADVTIIRLRRAGVDCRRISAIFSRRFMPNTVACWLKARESSCLPSTCEPVLVAGPLRSELEKAGNGALLAEFVEKAGFEHGTAAVVEERLEFGNILLGVTTASEAQASAAFQIFKNSLAELVAVSGGPAAGALVSDLPPVVAA